MEKEIRVLEELRSQIEKGRANYKKTPKERITASYLKARLEGLEVLIARFISKHEELVMEHGGDKLSGTSYMKNESFEIGFETYMAYKGEITKMLSAEPESRPTGSGLPGESSSKDSVLKLPKINIPVFSGKYSEFMSFKDLFLSLIHRNSSLDDVQRLHFLKTQVKGEAEQLIRHIPITGANYKKCWELLTSRYENKRFLCNAILKRLFGQRTMNGESAQALKELLDNTSDCVHELKNLGIAVESWDLILIHIVSQKLDQETRKQWELHANQSSLDLPSLKMFNEFLECRFRALEFVEPTKNKAKANNSPKVLHTTSNANITCPHCNENHKLYSCSQFAKENVAKRQEIVKALNLCYNCMGNNHFGKSCRVFTRCRICKGKHHSLLHGKSKSESTDHEEEKHPESTNSTDTTETINIRSHLSTGQRQTLLATALVKAESRDGSKLILRALLDQGSQASFISEAAVQLLRLKKIAVKSVISGLGDAKSSFTSKAIVKVTIQSLFDANFTLPVTAHVLNTVTSVLPDNKFILPKWAELGHVQLADPQYNTPNKIDILLGSEVYCAIIKEGLLRSPTGSTIAQNTCLGWVLSGQVGGRGGNNDTCHNIIMSLHVKLEENELLKKFWEIESEPNLIKQKVLSPEEKACEEHFKATTSRDYSGRYVVELPFRKDTDRDYGDTRAVAVKRLVTLEKRQTINPNLRRDYAQVLQEYITLGHMEKIDNGPYKNDKTVWLPHHAVVRMDKSTTKMRVVFNASDKTANGVSLNSTLMVGPTLQPELRHTIMRWRQYPICLTADIVKMYRMVRISQKHVDYQRIVWRDNVNEKIEDYRLLTVTFGMACAPYLAVKALQQVALDEGQYYPLAASRVPRDFYMDDLLTGCESETEAVKLYGEMNALLEKGGFTLQKWASNKPELLEIETDNTRLNREFKEDDITKVVGLTWNRRTDEFNYSVNLSDSSIPKTKREILSEICRLYDPLGWISPCIIRAKIFIQRLWIAGLDWDERLPESLLREWTQYRDELSKLLNFQIPRWVHRSEEQKHVALHGFGDASNAAFAAVVYIRCVSADGTISTHLVTSKTKVAPIKQVSIPRLELCAVVLAAKLLREVSDVLNVSKENLHAWTDSTIVLAWLSDHPSRWKTFIANRTSEVLSCLDASQFSYVRSEDNPADCASRGIPASELIDNELWKYGPAWLQKEHINYTKPQSICKKTDLEAKNIKAHTLIIEHDPTTELWSKFSSLRKLIRVVAYCRRFLRLKNSEMAKTEPLPYLTAPEIKDSLTCCIKQHQQHSFRDDITRLLKQKEVSKKSKMSTLNPFLDDQGILRVGGRLTNSDLPDRSKHPIIICGDSHLAKLTIADAHEKTMHGGQQLTCNYIRTRYWVTKLKNLVRSHIHQCVPCIRNAAKTRTQLMGQLPRCRSTPNKPFLFSGVDYAGPINIRMSKGRGNKSYKGYICLFICMSTRAVHIEAVSCLSSSGFLAAFKRFVARRGRCVQLWSDNGTNFVGAAKELKTLLASETSSFPSEVATALANNGTEWRFIPPHSPNFGGLWEAGIKSTKHHLRRVIGDSTLTYEELATVLAQIESCLNSRPMAEISTHSDDEIPLTPGHFLIGEPLLIAPDNNYEQLQPGNLRRWQVTQRMVQQFWKRWSTEYLTHFFQRYKWKNRCSEVRTGDVVLVREDNLPPTKWLYGLVVELHPGKDNITRVVTLRYKGSLFQRPVSKLCPLPVHSDSTCL